MLLIDWIGYVFWFFFSSRRRHTRCALVTGVQTCALPISGMTDWEKKWGKDDAHALVRAGRGIAGLRLHAPGSSARGDGAHRMARRRADRVDGDLEIGRASCREREWQYV